MRLHVFSIAFFLLLPSVIAHADGTVLRAKFCGNLLFVSTTHGVSVLELSSPREIAAGDYLVGEVEKIGHTSVFDRTAGLTFQIVTEHRLSEWDTSAHIATYCHEPQPEAKSIGTVSAVCQGKTIVDTPEGFAVLEVISNGIAAKGDHLVGLINRIGRTTVLNKDSGATISVFVDDIMLSRAALQRKSPKDCR